MSVEWDNNVYSFCYGHIFKGTNALGTSVEETCIFEDSHIAIDTANKIGTKTVGIYDKYNYGQEEIKKIVTVYIKEGETLKKTH